MTSCKLASFSRRTLLHGVSKYVCIEIYALQLYIMIPASYRFSSPAACENENIFVTVKTLAWGYFVHGRNFRKSKLQVFCSCCSDQSVPSVHQFAAVMDCATHEIYRVSQKCLDTRDSLLKFECQVTSATLCVILLQTSLWFIKPLAPE